MKNENLIFFEYLQKIEPILYEHAEKMNVPTMEEDLSVLLFEATFYKYSKNKKYKERSLLLLDRLINVFHEKDLNPGFIEGFEGVLWTLNCLEEAKIIDDSKEFAEDLMPYFKQSLEYDIKKFFFDALHGSINKIQYLISSMGSTNPMVIGFVNDFIDSLYDNRESDGDCIFWYDEGIEEETKVVNLGYAHGLPSLLVFLLKLKEHGFKHDKTDILIDGIAKSLLTFKFKSKSDSIYPATYRIDGENDNLSSRLAYCYGDLGVAYAMAYYGTSSNQKELKVEAEKIINHICHRTIANSGILRYEYYHFFDTGFCHGIAGIVYILTLIDRLLPSDLIKERISYWRSELKSNLSIQLKIREEIRLPQYLQPYSGDPYVFEAQSIFTGYSGTGLVLLSLFYETYDWSDFFVLY